MCPLFDDSALGEDNDQVCMLDCAEAVGYREDGPVCHEVVQGFLDKAFGDGSRALWPRQESESEDSEDRPGD